MEPKDNIEAEEFIDPLANFEPKIYADDLERALAEEQVSAIHSTPFVAIPQDTPIHSALETLVGNDIACTMIVDDEDRLVGVFSDRDALDKVALEYEEVRGKPVSEVMTKNPVFVHEDDSTAAALCVMAVAGYRHVPVKNADEKVTGIVSPRRVVEFVQYYFENA